MDTHDQYRPFRIGFLLIDGFALMSYAAASEPLRAANLLAGRRLYDVQNIPASGARAVSSGGASVDATARMDGLLACDLLLVVAGGETSGAVAQAVSAALGVDAMQIGPEIDPGVPVLSLKGGVTLALKSGNFGSTDFFAKALALMEGTA